MAFRLARSLPAECLRHTFFLAEPKPDVPEHTPPSWRTVQQFAIRLLSTEAGVSLRRNDQGVRFSSYARSTDPSQAQDDTGPGGTV